MCTGRRGGDLFCFGFGCGGVPVCLQLPHSQTFVDNVSSEMKIHLRSIISVGQIATFTPWKAWGRAPYRPNIVFFFFFFCTFRSCFPLPFHFSLFHSLPPDSGTAR
jgi:hypothetical protein